MITKPSFQATSDVFIELLCYICCHFCCSVGKIALNKDVCNLNQTFNSDKYRAYKITLAKLIAAFILE